ncbi:hypothetical protein KEJ26_05990 [Candidatus Bathyarchaeota archaeon]|nr:hypothetical protein [Candidatus Bathyarchaeota archaeon]
MNITWEEYLKEIARNPYTGRWVVEVVEVLIRNQGKLLSDAHPQKIE